MEDLPNRYGNAFRASGGGVGYSTAVKADAKKKAL